MRVKAYFYCRDILGELRDGDYQLRGDATVRALYYTAQGEAGVSYGKDVADCLNILVNNRQAGWDTVLHEDDTVRVLFKVLGG